MKLKIHSNSFEVPPQLKQVIENKALKLTRWLPTFDERDLALNATLEDLHRTQQFHIVLVLTFPQHSIRAEALESAATTCALRAFDELVRRVKRFKSQLSHDQRRHRQLNPPSAVGASAAEASDIADGALAVGQSLERVENYIRRELYHRSFIDGFPLGWVEPQAILDEVFLEARAQFSNRPTDTSLDQWLIRVAREAVQRRAAALETDRNQPHLEERAHRPERWDEESLYFYQPDEALRVEDLLPDERIATPEELLVRHEREEQLRRAIAQLPGEIRESFVLFALEGFNSDEVAMITQKPPARVLEEVQEAQGLLRRSVA